jgi:hypothetical protein
VAGARPGEDLRRGPRDPLGTLRHCHGGGRQAEAAASPVDRAPSFRAPYRQARTAWGATVVVMVGSFDLSEPGSFGMRASRGRLLTRKTAQAHQRSLRTPATSTPIWSRFTDVES